MSIGPIDVVAMKFPGSRFSGEIAPALAELVERRIVRIIDLAFVKKDGDGVVEALELDAMDLEVALALDPYTDEVMGLLSEDDIAQIAAQLEPESTAMLVVFEELWDDKLRLAVRNSGGELVGSMRIPEEVVEAALQARAVGAGETKGA